MISRTVQKHLDFIHEVFYFFSTIIAEGKAKNFNSYSWVNTVIPIGLQLHKVLGNKNMRCQKRCLNIQQISNYNS